MVSAGRPVNRERPVSRAGLEKHDRENKAGFGRTSKGPGPIPIPAGPDPHRDTATVRMATARPPRIVQGTRGAIAQTHANPQLNAAL